MRTDELINALAADRAQRAPIERTLVLAAAAGALLALLAVALVIGVRADIAQAAPTARFLFKPLVTLTLAAAALGLVIRLARPGARLDGWAAALLAVPVLLLLGVGAELLTVPPAAWERRLVGANGSMCLVLVAVLALGPLACLLLALRRGAPTRPALAGAVAGALAGGIAATFYALHCTDDSPLFVAAWYTAAILLVSLAGAAAGARMLRW